MLLPRIQVSRRRLVNAVIREPKSGWFCQSEFDHVACATAWPLREMQYTGIAGSLRRGGTVGTDEQANLDVNSPAGVPLAAVLGRQSLQVRFGRDVEVSRRKHWRPKATASGARSELVPPCFEQAVAVIGFQPHLVSAEPDR
jgi:hypothetical protein